MGVQGILEGEGGKHLIWGEKGKRKRKRERGGGNLIRQKANLLTNFSIMYSRSPQRTHLCDKKSFMALHVFESDYFGVCQCKKFGLVSVPNLLIF